MKLSQRESRLLLVLVLVAAAFGLRFLFGLLGGSGGAPGAPRVESAGPTTGRTAAGRFGRGARGATAIPDQVVALELEQLTIQPRDLTVGRDPFRFGPLPPPPPPPGPTAEELERRRREEEERLRRLAEQRALDAIPRPPEVTVVYLGSFGPSARRVAVFADAGRDKLYNALEGDILEGKFIVDRIGYESVDLKFVGFPDAPAKRLAIGG